MTLNNNDKVSHRFCCFCCITMYWIIRPSFAPFSKLMRVLMKWRRPIKLTLTSSKRWKNGFIYWSNSVRQVYLVLMLTSSTIDKKLEIYKNIESSINSKEISKTSSPFSRFFITFESIFEYNVIWSFFVSGRWTHNKYLLQVRLFDFTAYRFFLKVVYLISS